MSNLQLRFLMFFLIASGGIYLFIYKAGSAWSQSLNTDTTGFDEFEWDLPKGFPIPLVPETNPMSAEKVELGRHLFYDVRLSINQKMSCATCHHQDKAFTDGMRLPRGTTGEIHPRNSMTLANVAYAPSLNWANPNVVFLERHAMIPIFGEEPVELGMSGKEELLLVRLKKEDIYQKLFDAAYPESKDKVNLNQITEALASFIRTLISGNSPYDQYKYQGIRTAISESAKRGEGLFFSETFECFDCHTGFNFAGPQVYRGNERSPLGFENNGLYNIDGKGAYPPNNTGLFEFTNKPGDMGMFKVPTLRNIELTAPYMHDGSIATLEDVLEHYRVGGRTIKTGRYTGDGSANPNKSSFVRGFDMTEQEKLDMLEFLKSLTDRDFTTNKKFSDPWRNK